jgi:predicted Zn-dependent peptidase
VVSERLESARSVALGLWIDSGSRSEPRELGGVSHFIEHLIFKGTESWSALDIARKLDEMGGELNAATSKEYTRSNSSPRWCQSRASPRSTPSARSCSKK